jgi:acyl-CoA hydrolase
MPRDANPSGDIFGGWTVSQMDLAGATFASEVTCGRVATVSIEAMEFLRPIAVGDEVSCYCTLLRSGETSVTVRIETWARGRGAKGVRRSPREPSFSWPWTNTGIRELSPAPGRNRVLADHIGRAPSRRLLIGSVT